MKQLLLSVLFFLFSFISYAQPPLEDRFPDYSFKNYQMSFDRVRNVFAVSEFNIRKMFEDKKIKYPCKSILFRAYKSLQ